MIEDSIRPLTESERRLLNAVISFQRRRLKLLSKRTARFAIASSAVLCLLTVLLVRDLPWWTIAGFWAVIGTVIAGWLWVELRLKELPQRRLWISRLESALQRNEARVRRIQSDEVVEFEEEEDEGACFAFQLRDQHIIFISGQEFYPSARFPNNDFSLIDILDGSGPAVETLIGKHGRKLRPTRRISAAVKSKLKIPNHLQIIQGKLADIERAIVGA